LNTKRFLWARSCCLGDINISVGKVTWSNSKQSSWNTLSFIGMLQIWFWRGSYELDPIGLPIEICQLTGLQYQVQKHLFEHLTRILCRLCCFKQITRFFMHFLIFFLCHHPWKPFKNTVWCRLDYIIRFFFVRFGLYNPNTLSFL
jgi:hypothetical protein